MQSQIELLHLFEERFSKQIPFPQEPAALYDPCRYLLGWGGKRIRPVACLMANELFGEITEDAWHAAMALELFHNFTLVHDDIMDQAPLRRGKPTIHNHFGLTAGILGGDVLCIFAYQQLQQIKNKLSEILGLFNQTAIQVCEGQQWDMVYEQQEQVRIENYLHMILLKTSVLLAASLKIGALAGGATEGNAEKLYHFGENIGLAFQLKDDYLDAFGDPLHTGKQVGGDILANKKTWLLIEATRRANTAQQQELLQQLQHPTEDKVERVKQIILDTGAAAACEQAILHYSNEAFALLESVAVVSKRKIALQELAENLLNRTS